MATHFFMIPQCGIFCFWISQEIALTYVVPHLGNAPQAAYVVPGGVAPVMLFEDVTSVSVTLTPKDYPGGDRV